MQQRQLTLDRSLAIGGVSYSADTFVVNQSLVLRINIYVENRQLLVAAKRWRQVCEQQAITEIH